MSAPTSDRTIAPTPPIAAFPAVMGIAGLGLSWRTAGQDLPAVAPMGEVLLALAGLLWVSLVLAYAAKGLRSPRLVAEEFADPIRSNLFAAPSIGGLLLAAGLVPYTQGALWLWATAAAWQLAIALVLIGRWIAEPMSLRDVTTLSFLPIVGNIVAPLAGVPLGYVEVSWFLFTVGLVLWLVTLPVVLHRLILCETPLPQRLTPTLAIFVAPPAVGCLSHLALTGRFDETGRLLFFTALFFALLVLRLAPQLRKAPFSPAWWSTTFPSVALAGAALRYSQAVPDRSTAALAWTCLIGATAIVALVASRTLLSLVRAAPSTRRRDAASLS